MRPWRSSAGADSPSTAGPPAGADRRTPASCDGAHCRPSSAGLGFRPSLPPPGAGRPASAREDRPMGRKWSRSSRVSGALALVFGLAAFLAVRGYAERVRALAPALGRPVRVVVAASDLPRATRLTPDMLGTATYPSRFVPPGALRSPAAALDRVLVAGLSSGEVLTRT